MATRRLRISVHIDGAETLRPSTSDRLFDTATIANRRTHARKALVGRFGNCKSPRRLSPCVVSSVTARIGLISGAERDFNIAQFSCDQNVLKCFAKFESRLGRNLWSCVD